MAVIGRRAAFSLCGRRAGLVGWQAVRLRLAMMVSGVLLLMAGAEEAGKRVWDQRKAKKMVSLMLELEKTGTRPWNGISWRPDPGKAAAEAKRSGKPLFVFFHRRQEGAPEEPCCPVGRLIRAIALSDGKVQGLVTRNFVPLKVGFGEDEGFPLDWPALEDWKTVCKFSNGKGFAGCSVVSPDLEVEYGNTGSAMIWEMFDSTAFDAGKFAAMLERAVSRFGEERALRAQRGISASEMRSTVSRFREGIRTAVKSEGVLRLPPEGFTLEQAVELLRLAGAVK